MSLSNDAYADDGEVVSSITDDMDTMTTDPANTNGNSMEASISLRSKNFAEAFYDIEDVHDLAKLLIGRNVDEDLTLYPDIYNRSLAVTDQVRAYVRDNPYMRHMNSDPLKFAIAAAALQEEIGLACTAKDMVFDFKEQIPAMFFLEDGTVVYGPQYIPPGLKVNDIAFNCKFTEKSCGDAEKYLQDSDPASFETYAPFIYKRFDHCYFNKDDQGNFGPWEGCIAYGNLRNMCRLMGATWQNETGECIVDDRYCTARGQSYDEKSKNCMIDNTDFFMSLILSETYLIGKQESAFHWHESCKKNNIDNKTCDELTQAFTSIAGAGAFVTQSLVGIASAAVDVKPILDSYKNQWEEFIKTTQDKDDPNHGWKSVLQAAQVALGTVTTGVGVLVGTGSLVQDAIVKAIAGENSESYHNYTQGKEAVVGILNEAGKTGAKAMGIIFSPAIGDKDAWEALDREFKQNTEKFNQQLNETNARVKRQIDENNERIAQKARDDFKKMGCVIQ